MNNRQTGAYGEAIAKEYLSSNGYEIIDTNVHFSKFCELDIVAKKGNVISFVEVKTRKNIKLGLPLEAITKNKYDNIKKGAYFYLQQNHVKYNKFQIDVIGIVLEPELKITHLDNVCYG